MAAKAGLLGMDPMEVLQEDDPEMLVIREAVIVRAHKLRENEMKDQAAFIVNALGKAMK